MEPKTTLRGAEQQMGNERGLLLSTEVLYTDAAEGRDGFPASLMPSASLTGNPGPRLQGPGHPRGGALRATRASPVLGSPRPAPLSAQGLGAMGHFLGAQLPEGCGERKDPEASTCLPLVSHSPTWSSNLPGRHQKAISPEPALTDPASVCLRPPTSPHPQQQPPASPCPPHPAKPTQQPGAQLPSADHKAGVHKSSSPIRGIVAGPGALGCKLGGLHSSPGFARHTLCGPGQSLNLSE